MACGAAGRQSLRDITEPDPTLPPAEVPEESTPGSYAQDSLLLEKQKLANRPVKLGTVAEKSKPITEGSRAWARLVGWHPGGSAFPDPMTHEAHSMISISR